MSSRELENNLMLLASKQEVEIAIQEVKIAIQEVEIANQESIKSSLALISANKELISTNEELISTNEKLISTNEELIQYRLQRKQRKRLFTPCDNFYYKHDRTNHDCSWFCCSCNGDPKRTRHKK